MLGFMTLATAPSATAAENIRFDAKPSDIEKLRLTAYLKQPTEQLQLAQVDLNEDGLPEYIVRTGCEDFCHFLVLAKKNDMVLEIGNIYARALELGASYSGSVRNIIAFQTPGNDYKQTVYSWEPASAQYMINKEKE
jgi:hypothetical protein